MKPPRCRFCGKGHYGLCKEISRPAPAAGPITRPAERTQGQVPEKVETLKSANVTAVPDVKLFKQSLTEMARDVLEEIDNLGPASADDVLDKAPTKLFMPAFSSEADVENAKKLVSALIPAQRQKAYRERGGDKLRERERLRMAAKRKEKSDG